MPWLAPEQIKGQTAPAQAADIFALGLLAFFAVTGKPYWRSIQTKASDTAALRREILGERMPASVRASEYSITLNPAADTVFARALAFRPADRYATAREFAVALEAVLTGRSVTEMDADRPSNANVASTAKASAASSGDQPAGSPADMTVGPRGLAPPPRQMPHRATMLGMGSRPAAEPAIPAATGARPPAHTMLGMGQPIAEVLAAVPAKPAPYAMPAAAPAKPAPPAMPTAAPAKTFAPAMPTAAPAKPSPPAMPTTAPAKTFAPATTTAMFAEPARTPQKEPPPLPFAPPPPRQMEEVLATFEAIPAAPLTTAVGAAPSVAVADVAPAPPAWSIAEPRDASTDRVETGVAVIGPDFTDPPKKSHLRLIASVCGLIVLTAGTAWTLSGRGTPNSPHAAPNAKETAKVAPAAAPIAPVADPPSPTAEHVVEESPPAAAPEPAVPPPAPAVDEPQVAEPPVHAAPQAAAKSPATPRPSPNKNCGKFLKRCK
jgi:hypothetical protein